MSQGNAAMSQGNAAMSQGNESVVLPIVVGCLGVALVIVIAVVAVGAPGWAELPGSSHRAEQGEATSSLEALFL